MFKIEQQKNDRSKFKGKPDNLRLKDFAEQNGVPYSTLWRAVKLLERAKEIGGIEAFETADEKDVRGKVGGLGRPLLLDKEEQKELIDFMNI